MRFHATAVLELNQSVLDEASGWSSRLSEPIAIDVPPSYFRRWARSDAAARFAAIEAEGDRSVLDAADAAALPVRRLLPTCERSDAAARLAAFGAPDELSVVKSRGVV
jgi:hypothetical protein